MPTSYFVLQTQVLVDRKQWALDQCAVIQTGIEFEKCRLKVPNYDYYYELCLYDACGYVCLESKYAE